MFIGQGNICSLGYEHMFIKSGHNEQKIRQRQTSSEVIAAVVYAGTNT